MTNGENPAYPVPEYTLVAGLTKRELFAAMAMQGQLAHRNGYTENGYGVIASDAVEFADALIAELNKEVQP